MSLSDALKEKVLDIRLRDKLLAEGKLSEADLKTFLNELSDDEGCSQPLYPEKSEEE